MNPGAAAQRIVATVEARGKEEGKQITRFQLSNKSLSELCERNLITGSYIGRLADEIIEHGWCCFQVTSTSYGFLRLSTAQNFRRFNAETLMGFIGDGSDDVSK